jgi:hypothetical protein
MQSSLGERSDAECSAEAKRARVAHHDDVVRLTLYHDIFHHPLTVEELAALCGPQTPAAIAAAVARGALESDGRLVWRRGRAGDCERRRKRSEAAERLWSRARASARVLGTLPFVRGVLVTGSMSKRSAAEGGDIDFLLLVEPGRVWTTKALIQGVRRALPEWARAASCANYLLSTDALAVTPQTMYTAVELATAIPMANPEACVALVDANPWVRRFVPGIAWSRARCALAAPLPPKLPLSEALVPRALEGPAERWVTGFWDRRYAWLSQAERERRFRRGAGVATNHLHDFSRWVEEEFATRLNSFGVAPP